MNTYITLMKLTSQGAKDIKNAPKRVEAAFKALEMMGGKLVSFYVTFGEYDYIGVGEAPSDEVVAAYNLALSSLGNVRTMTLRAFTLEQFAGIVKKIP